MPPVTRSKRTPAQHRSLPLEIVHLVLSFLDPIADSATLATTMRVSSGLWDVAGGQLYTNLTVDTLDSLLFSAFATSSIVRVRPHSRYRNRHLNARARRALAMTTRLVLGPPKGFADDLFTAKVIGGPLFPNVSTLLLVNESSRPLPQYSNNCAPDIVLFDRPDVCVKSRMKTLPGLSLGSARIITFHGYPVDDILGPYTFLAVDTILPRTGEEFRIYHTPAPNFFPKLLPGFDQRLAEKATYPCVKVRFDGEDEEALKEAFGDYKFERIIEDKDMGPCKVCGDG